MKNLKIGIVGPMGVGKSTLVSKLKTKWPRAKFLDEVFVGNPYLPKAYKNPKKYAFHSQIWQLGKKAQTLQRLEKRKFLVFVPLVNDLAYAETYLSAENLQTYRLLYKTLADTVLKPDVLLKLTISDKALIDRVNMRNRDFEKGVSPKFLSRLNQNMTLCCQRSGLPIVRVDAEHKDFRDAKAFSSLAREIEGEISKKTR